MRAAALSAMADSMAGIQRTFTRWAALAALLPSVACVELRAYQRHGRTYEMSPSGVALYEASVRAAAAEPGVDDAERARAACERLNVETGRFRDWDEPGVSPGVPLDIDRRGACALADRLARAKEAQEAEQRRAADAAVRAAQARQAEVEARAAEAREVERRAAEAALREAAEREAAEALAARRARCAEIRVQGTFEARVARVAADLGGGPEPGGPVMALVAKALRTCDAGDEFDRRRCTETRDAARARVGQDEMVVGARAPLHPMDFRTSRFPVDVPRIGRFALDPYGDEAAGGDESPQARLMVEAEDHRVTVPITDPANAEAIKKAGAPLAIMLVRGRGFERGGVRTELDQLAAWRLASAGVGVESRLRTRSADTWQQGFTTVGVQILSPTDGAVLFSQPPALELMDVDPAACVEVEQDQDRQAAFRVRVALLKAALGGTDPFVRNRDW